MSTAQIEQLITQKTKGLPVDILQEVLDFIEFLRFKNAGIMTDSLQLTLSDADVSELSHLDEEFADYKTIYPRE